MVLFDAVAAAWLVTVFTEASAVTRTSVLSGDSLSEVSTAFTVNAYSVPCVKPEMVADVVPRGTLSGWAVVPPCGVHDRSTCEKSKSDGSVQVARTAPFICGIADRVTASGGVRSDETVPRADCGRDWLPAVSTAVTVKSYSPRGRVISAVPVPGGIFWGELRSSGGRVTLVTAVQDISMCDKSLSAGSVQFRVTSVRPDSAARSVTGAGGVASAVTGTGVLSGD